MEAIDRVFAEIANYSKTMGNLHGDFLQIVHSDIKRFEEMTAQQTSQMQWQGWSVIGLTTLGASLAIAGALVPKGSSSAITPQLANSSAAAKMLKTISDKLKDNDFLRTTCETSSKFFSGVAPAVNIWQDGTTKRLESKRELLRLAFQEGQQEKGSCSQEVKRSQEAMLGIFQAKARGG